jgi:hypothetical protein
LQDGTRVQIDLQEPPQVDKILLGTTPLKYVRDSGAVYQHYFGPYPFAKDGYKLIDVSD